MEINEQVEKILTYGDCCDHCLGRFFGKRSHGLSDDERGRGLRIARALALNQPYRAFHGHLLDLRELLRCCPRMGEKSDCCNGRARLAPSLSAAGSRR